MLSHIKDILFRWIHHKAYKRAVKKADRLRSENFKKHFVILINGKFEVISKQRLKLLYHLGALKKGANLRQIEKRVLYTTK